jgi:hypothetical protein
MGRCRRHRGPGSGTGSPAAAAAGDPWLLWEFWWVAWEYWREYGVAARPLRGRPGRGFLVGAGRTDRTAGKRELGDGRGGPVGRI